MGTEIPYKGPDELCKDVTGIVFDEKTYDGKVLNKEAVGTETSPLASPINDPAP